MHLSTARELTDYLRLSDHTLTQHMCAINIVVSLPINIKIHLRAEKLQCSAELSIKQFYNFGSVLVCRSIVF